MIHAEFLTGTEPICLNAPGVVIGAGEAHHRTVARVGVSDLDGPRLRIDIQGHSEWSCFRGVSTQDGLVAIGFQECLYVVHLESLRVTQTRLEGYFGHIYPASAFQEPATLPFSFLVAGASQLVCIGRDGSIAWIAQDLGIDGVTVESIEHQIITGAGEWDPPGGWRPFALALGSGTRVR